VWAVRTKSGIKTANFDRWDCDDFIIRWLKSLVEVAGEVSKDNMYDCINYTTENIPNFVPVFGFNSARFDMNFIIDILRNPPHLYIEFFIPYDGLNSTNYMEVLNKSEPFTQVDFHSTLRTSDISDKYYQTYLVDWKEKMFTNR
jgi:hypothetical protein